MDTINARGCVAVIAAAVVGVNDEVVQTEIVEDCGGVVVRGCQCVGGRREYSGRGQQERCFLEAAFRCTLIEAVYLLLRL